MVPQSDSTTLRTHAALNRSWVHASAAALGANDEAFTKDAFVIFDVLTVP